jgi:hypothetical protein
VIFVDQRKISMIECEWKKEGRVQINPDGQVYPCCYLCNPHYKFLLGFKSNLTHKEHKDEHTQHIWDKYNDNKEKFNINNRSLEEILNDKWFTETLPKSWESEDTALVQCIEHCTVDKKDE